MTTPGAGAGSACATTAQDAVSSWGIFFLAAALLGYEVSLLRILLYASWHHFAFLVISVALLGFGISGTALTLAQRWTLPRAGGLGFALIAATALTMPLGFALAQTLPVQAHFLAALLGRQVLAWLAYWLLLALPFFFGGAGIGLALQAAGPRPQRIYAVNLAGSAAGAILATLAMHWLAPAWLPTATGGLVLLGLLGQLSTRRRRVTAAVLLASSILFALLGHPRIRHDDFKYRSYVENLLESKRARPVGRAHGPAAVAEAFAGDVFHELAFLSPGTAPPALTALLLDGHWAGSLIRAEEPADAAAVDLTLMALAYAFAPDQPRVLLLGEVGGANVWLALRRQAVAVEVVQPNRELLTLLQGPLHSAGGSVLTRPEVELIVAAPRHRVESSSQRYDLIHLSQLESWAVASGGLGGMRQNNLLTVEGMAACLSRLEGDGVLSLCRAVQMPPRDQAKLLATLIVALQRRGSEDPGRHLVVVRDFLAACVLVRTRAWRESEIVLLREQCARRQLTPVYFPGIRDDELNRPDTMPGPPGEAGDWLHHVTRQLLAPEAEAFIARWPLDIRPPTDDRPFFGSFAKLGTRSALRLRGSDERRRQSDLSLDFVVASASIVVILGATLTLFPLLLTGTLRQTGGKGPTALYFGAIGIGYLALEMLMLARLTHLFGDPVLAGALAIAGFLCFSGLGSLAAARRAWIARIDAVFAALLILILFTVLFSSRVATWGGGQAALLRYLLAFGAVAPLGFLMGFPFPLGLARLGGSQPRLVPWAWGINGFASVLAPPLATLLGMLWGFKSAGALALLAYTLAAALYGAIGAMRRREERESGVTGERR